MNINFEQDKQDSLTKVDDAASLSEQVTKLQTMERDLSQKEDAIKKLKKDIEVISGEVIPTMMQEMNLSTLKLSDGSSVEVKPVYGASISAAKTARFNARTPAFTPNGARRNTLFHRHGSIVCAIRCSFFGIGSRSSQPNSNRA